VRLSFLFLSAFLLAAPASIAGTFTCSGEITFDVHKYDYGWNGSVPEETVWDLVVDQDEVQLSQRGQETITYTCSQTGVEIVCKGSLRSQFTYSPDSGRFIAFTQGVAFLIGTDRIGAKGPSMSLGSCKEV